MKCQLAGYCPRFCDNYPAGPVCRPTFDHRSCCGVSIDTSSTVFTALLYAMPSARRNLTVGSVGGWATSFSVCLLQQLDKMCSRCCFQCCWCRYCCVECVRARVRGGSGGVSGGAALDSGQICIFNHFLWRVSPRIKYVLPLIGNFFPSSGCVMACARRYSRHAVLVWARLFMSVLANQAKSVLFEHWYAALPSSGRARTLNLQNGAWQESKKETGGEKQF